jgi:hypothetical protein
MTIQCEPNLPNQPNGKMTINLTKAEADLGRTKTTSYQYTYDYLNVPDTHEETYKLMPPQGSKDTKHTLLYGRNDGVMVLDYLTLNETLFYRTR